MMIFFLSVFIFLFLFSGCSFKDDPYVDFGDIEGAKDLKFQVISQHETDLSQGLPYNCYLPDGTPVNEYSEISIQNSEVSIQDSEVSIQKVIRDGQLYIVNEGTMYNAQGAEVK